MMLWLVYARWNAASLPGRGEPIQSTRLKNKGQTDCPEGKGVIILKGRVTGFWVAKIRGMQ